MAVPFSALQATSPSAIIELFQLQLNALQHGVDETYYFHAGVDAENNGAITWNGQAYLAFPIEATDFEYTGTGSLPRPKLRVSNIFGTITALLLGLPNGLEGAKVTRVRTLARYIDGINFPGGTNPYGTPDPTAEFPREIYYVDRKAGENRDVVEFELAAAFDLAGVRAPKRQCISNVCQWKYRGTECGYTGNAYFNFNDQPVNTASQDVCGKRLNSCELRFSQQRYAGNVTFNSNLLTLDRAVSLSSNDPVTGYGLPAGTTVVSVNSNLVTLSQNSTATTSVTTTGTIQSNTTQIVLTSSTGIVPGMTVSGPYLPANVQVTAKAGNTITLSAPVNFTQFYSAVGSFTGQVDPTNDYIVQTSNLSAPGSVGQILAAPEILDLSRGAVITSILNYAVAISPKSVTTYRAYKTTQAVSNNTTTTFTVYQLGAVPSATYTFTATDRNYTFRASANLPYGSYPGVGTFFT